LLSLLRASHIGPTAAVTFISFLLATSLWWEGPAFVIAFGIFLGQLLVGWSNDLNDYPDDLKHNRTVKPLVSGEITSKQLLRAIKICAPFTLIFNLFGPLGIKGGLLYLFGVGMGVAYNFYFKSTLFSPLPYALAFAALVSSIVISTDRTPPIWLITCGALLGALLVIGLIAAAITSIAPNSVIFKSLIITVIIDLILLLNAVDSELGSLVI